MLLAIVFTGAASLLSCDGPTARVLPHFDYSTSGGCANVFMYRTSSDGLESVVVDVDRRSITLSATDTSFDLSKPPAGLRVWIDLRPRKGLAPYCTDVVDPAGPAPIVWRAVAGRVTVHVLATGGRLGETYSATALLKDVVFEDEQGHRLTQPEPILIEATVGWLPG